tara:strand:- start:3266 stop:3487 length:222 start_codon:yes stop_codon:yes gene_type:complete
MNKDFENALIAVVKDVVSDIDYTIKLSKELSRMGFDEIGEALILADENNLDLFCASHHRLIMEANLNLQNRGV